MGTALMSGIKEALPGYKRSAPHSSQGTPAQSVAMRSPPQGRVRGGAHRLLTWSPRPARQLMLLRLEGKHRMLPAALFHATTA